MLNGFCLFEKVDRTFMAEAIAASELVAGISPDVPQITLRMYLGGAQLLHEAYGAASDKYARGADVVVGVARAAMAKFGVEWGAAAVVVTAPEGSERRRRLHKRDASSKNVPYGYFTTLEVCQK